MAPHGRGGGPRFGTGMTLLAQARAADSLSSLGGADTYNLLQQQVVL